MSDKAVILEPEEFKQIFSEKKREILNNLYVEDYDSISELADDLDRNISIVSRDLAKLEEIGIVSFVEEKGKKKPTLVSSQIRVNKFDVSSLLPLHSKSEPELYNKNLVDNENGIKYGENKGDNIYLDRWSLSQGANQITVGKIGSGKSYSNKLNILRSYDKNENDNLKIIMVDPVGGFDSINRILNGKKIEPEKDKINPMKIKEMSDIPGSADPYNVKIDNLLNFFEIFYKKRSVEMTRGERRVLAKAIDLTYNDFGITREIETHSKKSPTLNNLIDKLQDMKNNPEKYNSDTKENYIPEVGEKSSKILSSINHLKSHESYEYLLHESNFDLNEQDVTYFDLSFLEGTGDVGLIMHLIMGEVYQETLSSDKKIMLYVDEAHYLFDDAGNLDFLESMTRHSKQLNLSINFITQLINEIFYHEQAESIFENIPIRLFHRTESHLSTDARETLNLENSHIEYMKNAHPGSREWGYSEALLGVKGQGYIPIRVTATDEEHEILTIDENNIWNSLSREDS